MGDFSPTEDAVLGLLMGGAALDHTEITHRLGGDRTAWLHRDRVLRLLRSMRKAGKVSSRPMKRALLLGALEWVSGGEVQGG